MGVAFVAGQWHDGATRDTTGPQPDARITTLWSSDHLVQRHSVGLSEGEEQFEAGAPLPGLETREGALRDAGVRRHLGQAQTAARTQGLQPRAYVLQRGENGWGS